MMTQSLRSIPFTSKKCGNCGHRNAPNANFCSQCGMKLDSTPLPPVVNTPQSVPPQAASNLHIYSAGSQPPHQGSGLLALNAEDAVRPVPADSAADEPQDSADSAESSAPSAGAKASQAGNNVGVKCANCGHQNRPGALVCANCFELLTNSPTTVPTRHIPQEALAQMKLNTVDTWNEEKGAYQGVQPGTSVFQPNMLAALRFKGSAADTLTLRLTRQPLFTLGRADPTQSLKPDLDMTPYAGQQLGVSRQHAIIELKGTGVYLTDLRSSNGTFLNDTRLAPHEPHQVRDGDTIRLGQLEMRLFFQIQQGPS
jgi:uncharacterized OB-fold protein